MALTVGLISGTFYRVAADSTAAEAAQLSDRAFNLLNSINARGGSQPLAAPVANFAADAQTLSQALGSGDKAGASSAMAALESDRAAVDSAIRGSDKTAGWDPLKQQLDAIAKIVPAGPTAPPPAMRAAAPPSATPDCAAETAPPIMSASVAPALPERIGPMPATSASAAPPKAVIESQYTDTNGLRIKGYLEGTELKSAGIYQDGQLLKTVTIHSVNGEQRIDFDIGLGSAGPGMSIRVTDVQGRSAEAFVSAPAVGNLNSSTGDTTPAPRSAEEVDHAALANAGASAAGTAEIPSHGHTRPSPSKRHTIQGHLGDVQIDVVALRQIAVTPLMYEVLGVIQGRDVTRAGVYIDGRLAARIPVSSSASVNNIDQRFVADGRAVTIRAFGVGNNYVEQPVDLSTAVANASPMLPTSNPMMSGAGAIASVPAITGLSGNAVPGTIAIRIDSVTNLAATRTVVKGEIIGRGVRTIALYQNGVLDQNIPVSAGQGLLGSVLSHFGSQSVPFMAYYNPANGPAVIRATDSTGAYTEQPVALGDVNGYMNAPAAVNNVSSSPGGLSW